MNSESIETPNTEDEEDVPSDFFDDFCNQDFMEGLDIVDAWDDDCAPNPLEPSISTPHKSSPNNSSITQNTERENLKAKEQKLNQTIKELKLKLEQTKSRLSSDRQNDRSKSRRDPEKTRRDIQKDKVRCEKVKEARIIDEKLKMVETGLVPPGTEMELDLAEMDKKKAKKSPVSLEHRTQSLSAERRRIRLEIAKIEREKARVLGRKLRRSRSWSRERSDHKKGRPIKPTTYRSHYRRSRSPLHKSRSPIRRRSRDSRSPICREKSSNYRRQSWDRISTSGESERERWLRRRANSPRRNLRRSPRRIKQSSKEEAEKKSFLEEIREKLNETPLRPMMQIPMAMPPMGMPPMGMPMPMPQPYMQPQMVPPPPQLQPQYDQQFFIGQCDMGVPMQVPYMNMLQPQPQMYAEEVQPTPVPPPVAPPANSNNIVIEQQKTEEENKRKEDALIPPGADIAKLFADKKISLSDFLSVAAKPTDSPSSNLHTKIKVLSRCQDAIRELRSESLLCGRLFIKKNQPPPEKKLELANPSPLRKVSIIRLTATTAWQNKSPKDPNIITPLEKLRQCIGVTKENPTKESKPAKPIKPALNHATNESTSAKQPTATLNAQKKDFSQSRHTQTAEFKCTVCAVREKNKFADASTETEDNVQVDMWTQVREEDLMPAKDLPKNQSLAHLTPAQLLQQTQQANNHVGGDKRNVSPRSASSARVGGEASGSVQKLQRSDDFCIARQVVLDNDLEYVEDFEDYNKVQSLPRSNKKFRRYLARRAFQKGRKLEQQQQYHHHQQQQQQMRPFSPPDNDNFAFRRF